MEKRNDDMMEAATTEYETITSLGSSSKKQSGLNQVKTRTYTHRRFINCNIQVEACFSASSHPFQAQETSNYHQLPLQEQRNHPHVCDDFL